MEKRYVIKVATDGRVEREPFDAADSLGQLQRAVGGYIERVPVRLKGGVDLFVDEEGLLKGLPRNGVLVRFDYAKTHRLDVLAGAGVFAAHDDEGETVGLTEAECVDIETSLARCGAHVIAEEQA